MSTGGSHTSGSKQTPTTGSTTLNRSPASSSTISTNENSTLSNTIKVPSDAHTSAASGNQTVLPITLVNPLPNFVAGTPTSASSHPPTPMTPVNLPQVQVIHQSMPTPSYLHHLPYNPQFMIQNAAALQAMQLNLAALQGRMPSVAPHNPIITSVKSSPSSLPQISSVSALSLTSHSMSSATSRSSSGSFSKLSSGNGQSITPMNSVKTQGGHSTSSTSQQVIFGMMPTQSIGFLSSSMSNDVTKLSTTAPNSQTFSSMNAVRLQNGQFGGAGPQILAPQMLTNSAILQAMTANLQQGLPYAHIAGQLPGQPVYIRATNLVQPHANILQASNLQQVLHGNLRPQLQQATDASTYVEQTTKNSPVTKSSSNQQSRVLSTILPMVSRSATHSTKVQTTQQQNEDGSSVVVTASSQPTTKVTKSTASLNIPQVSQKTQTVSKPRNKPTKVNVAVTTASSKPMKSLLNQSTVLSVSSTSSTAHTTAYIIVASSTPKATTAPSYSALSSSKLTYTTTNSTLSKTSDSVSSKDNQNRTSKSFGTYSTITTPTTVVLKTQNCSTPLLMTSTSTGVEKQRAVVKPQILTHVIDGFVIQEGPEPFPIQRSSLLTEFVSPVSYGAKFSDKDSEEEIPPLLAAENASDTTKLSRKRKHPFRSQESTWCIEKPPSLPQAEDLSGADDFSSSIGERESSSSPPNTPPSQPSVEMAVSDDQPCPPMSDPTTWTVQDVYDFVRSIKGCNSYAEEFRQQEIDGQALLLLKEDHLMTAMNMKLGPALKIYAQIATIKHDS